MLRRERVFDRDIFRFGTGTVIFLNLDGYLIAANLDLLAGVAIGLSIAHISLIAKIQASKTRPASIDDFMGMVLWKGFPLIPAIRT